MSRALLPHPPAVAGIANRDSGALLVCRDRSAAICRTTSYPHLRSALSRRPKVHHECCAQAAFGRFLVQCLYIDQFVEIVGIAIAVAFGGPITIRGIFGQNLHLDRIGISFLAQVVLEIIGDVTYALWEAGVLEFRKRVALWRMYQSQHAYVRVLHSFLAVLPAPLFMGLWIQTAVVGDLD